MPGKANEGTEVQITRNFQASREKVYKAWTRPEELSQWFAPSDEYRTIVEQLDVKEGGKYRIIMKHPSATHYLSGEFLHVDPEKRLVYTWQWENQMQPFEISRVTVEFQDRGHSTEVILTHQKLTTSESREKHTHGWNGCLDQLAKLLEAKQER